jgi:hypothetical protein
MHATPTHHGDPERLRASLRRLHAAQSRAAGLGEYVQALLVHANEAAAALRDDPPRGRVFRVGLATVGEDGLVAPLPFQRPCPSLFIDQFHAMPLAATSLGPLLERGRGDRIDDLEAHLRRRGVSLSTQVALREGVRANVRLPWRALDRRGFLWFSADAPRFFDDALFAHLESLVPEVELQLRLLDALEPLLPAGAARPRSLAGSGEGLARLRRLLETEESPFPEGLELAWTASREETGASLVNLWRLGEERALLCALQCREPGVESLRLLLTLRGWALQLAAGAVNPSRLLEGLERRLREARQEGSLDGAARPQAIALALLHLRAGHVDAASAGPALLYLEDAAGARPLAEDLRAPGEADGRAADARPLPAGSRLLLRLDGAPRLRVTIKPRTMS